jgi:hypothetical protein
VSLVAPPERAGTAALVVAAALFVAYPVLRPRGDGLDAMGSTAWVVAHLCAVAGFVLLVVGLDRLRMRLVGSPAGRTAGVAVLLTGVGVGLVLPYYGAEDFGLHAVGRLAVDRPEAAPVLALLPDAVRYAPVAAATFGIGLLGLAAGAVTAAVALRRSPWRSWAGLPLAVGLVLLLPQFWAPPFVRIGHGVLVGVGCLAVAEELWRGTRVTRSGDVSAAGRTGSPPAATAPRA